MGMPKSVSIEEMESVGYTECFPEAQHGLQEFPAVLDSFESREILSHLFNRNARLRRLYFKVNFASHAESRLALH